MSEPRNAIAFDTPAPVDGKGVGETGSSSFTASARKAALVELGDGSDPPLTVGRRYAADSDFRYLADALGFLQATSRAAAVSSPWSRSPLCRPGRPECSLRA